MYLAMLYASRIISGKNEYKQVPASLKENVKNILIEQGFEDLIIE